MAKERRTISIDPDVESHLSQDGVNASELVNQLVRQHMNGGAGEEQIVEFRLQQVESEYESALSQAKRKEEELAELRSRKEDLEQEKQAERQQVLDEVTRHFGATHFKSIDEYMVEGDDENLQRYADRLDDMDLEDLKEYIIQEEQSNE